jgi:tetrahydromethanopterin S-methyltransferase subunit E
MGSFNLADFFFPVVTFLSSLQRVFLFSNHSISSDKELFYLLFISIVRGSLGVVIFLIFAVKVEDNFGKLRYLL